MAEVRVDQSQKHSSDGSVSSPRPALELWEAMQRALVLAAIPLEALLATECDEAAQSLSPQIKNSIKDAVQAIRSVVSDAAIPEAQCDKCGRWFSQNTVKVRADTTYCGKCGFKTAVEECARRLAQRTAQISRRRLIRRTVDGIADEFAATITTALNEPEREAES